MDFFLWIGLVFAVSVLGILIWQDLPLLTSRQVRTKGTVYDHRGSLDDGARTYLAKIRFKAEDGRQIEIEDSSGGPAPKPPVGTLVDVVYPANAPDKGRVRRPFLRLLIYAFMLFVLAVVVGRLLGWLK